MRFVLSLLAIALAALVLSSCFDQEPGEIGVNCKLNGRGKPCLAVLMSSSGAQLQVAHTDFNGVGYLSQVKPGTYTVKFQDNSGNFYPAEYTVEVAAGSSETLEVDLNQAPSSTPAE